MKKFSGTKGMIILILLVAAVVGYYYYLSNKTDAAKEDNVAISKVSNVLLRDLKFNYPPTPREVMKYYSEITTCFYNEEYTDSELEELARKARELYDEQLVSENTWSEYMVDLRTDIEKFRNEGISLNNYNIASSANVDFFKDDGYEWARIYCSYSLKQDKKYQAVNEIFLLRKDENGLWKIFGWDLAENVNVDENEEVS